ncbi:MAG: Choline-sulfatase (EC [uncultured Caballeronia sp.]|nr:MAG: Choline-sulfatase (EC [uncultured Caballeronia sp.]
MCETNKTPPTDQQIRNARHAYYGAISYVDAQFGAIIEALDQAGLADDTIVIVTSDHGEMLGERGLWYKMTFFEGGCRVPLIVHAPGQFEAAYVSAFVSHLDLLLTLVELGHGQPRPAWPDSLDGRSLVPHLRGEAQAHDEAIGEYLAEGAIAPIVMLRCGEFKFIHTPSDPDQLFNVTADPLERTNLATLPEHAARVAAFREEIVGRWDLDALREEVVQSQRRRQFHFEVTTQGVIESWLATVGRCQPTLYAQSIDLDTLEAMVRQSPPSPKAACRSRWRTRAGPIDATNAIAGVVLKALGYKQSVSNLSVPITYQGLKKGQVDAFLGNWMPAQGPLVKQFVDEKLIDVVHSNLTNAKFTLAVPDYVAAAGVHSFADLQKNADKFDDKIYGIEPGAPANQNIKKMLDEKAFGLNGWKLVESSETSMLTQVERSVRDKKWIVFLAWEPHLTNTKFHLTYLDGGDKYFGPNFGGATVNTVSRAGYANEFPNVGRLFKQMTFNVDLEDGIIIDVLQNKTNVDTAAAALKRNPGLVKGWLDGITTTTGANGWQAVQTALGSK